jgi:predicted enzyme related to lactoylglutathione lyase
MARPIHFEIFAADPEAAARFYETVFGWTITKAGVPGDRPYWLIDTGEGELGINGGMGPQPGFPGTTTTLGVDDVRAVLAAAEANGATVAMPPTEIPNVGTLAYITDPEGHAFGLMQSA